MRNKKLEKYECEICGTKDKPTLHAHHIIPRTDLNCTNNNMNLAIICSNCHAKIHSGIIEIIGVFPATKPPNNRILIYKRDGVCNVPGMENVEPYYISKAPTTPLS